MEPREIVETAAAAAADKKASDIMIIDISNLAIFADYFLIASGQTNRQIEAIADGIEEKLREVKVRKIGLEGAKGGDWILMDYGSVIVHLFTQEQREYYSLERLWADAPHRKWEETG